VIARGEAIDRGTQVVVVEVRGNHLLVQARPAAIAHDIISAPVVPRSPDAAPTRPKVSESVVDALETFGPTR